MKPIILIGEGESWPHGQYRYDVGDLIMDADYPQDGLYIVLEKFWEPEALEKYGHMNPQYKLLETKTDTVSRSNQTYIDTHYRKVA